MTPLAKHILGASILGALMMTATLSFSAYQPENEDFSVAKADMLTSFHEQTIAYEPNFISNTELKEARGQFFLKTSDRQQIADAVIGQLKAFEEKDAEKAYSLAAPLARSGFASADHFLNNLDDMYQLLTMSKIERLDGLDMDNGEPKQRMLLTSPSGRHWIAYFSMQKQSSGKWKILGFMIEDAPGQMI